MSNDSTDKIVASLREWVASAPAGAKVPSSRALTVEHAASPVTVQKAMRKLTALGLIEARPGVGTFVRKVRGIQTSDYGWQTAALGASQAHASLLSTTQRTIASDAIGLHSGYPSQALLPERLVRSALARASRTTAVMTRSPSAGLPELQAWFANELAAFVPTGIAPPTARDALITAGSQSGLSSIFRAVVGTGQPLLIESPTYWGAIVAAKQAGVVLVPIPTGPHGPDPDDINRALVRTGARAFYAQPTFANPTGFTWSPEVRTAILEAVRLHGAFLIEDDWAHDLGIDADPHPLAAHDDEGRVIYLRSLTKSVSPALRVAAVIVRGPARERILADRAAESMYVSGLLQVAALDVVTQPAWRSHLRGFRQQLRARRDLLLTNLTQYAPSVRVDGIPEGGLNLWVRLPEATDVEHVVRSCELRGLIVAPGTEWFPAEASGPFIRLNYSNEEPDRFPAAARTLGETLAGAAQ
jgi:DNA-binding transcriptional MocR family regulator